MQLLAIAEDGPIALEEWRSIGGSAESFRQLDGDGDGRITFDEVEAAISKSPGASLNRNLFAEPNPHRMRSASNALGRRMRNPRFVGIAAAPAPVVATSLPSPAAAAVAAPAPSPAAPANPSSAKPMSLADDAAATTALPLDDGSNPYWAARNQQNLDRIANGEQARVLFLGDSGTDLFSIGLGRPLWEKYFVPLGSVNFAVGGATTSQVLWQIETGQVERMEPQVVVVLIGSNNLAVGQSPAAVARGITKVVNELQLRMPQSRVLLLGLMPRQAAATDPIRAKLAEVNRLIAGLDDGLSLRFVDFSNRMIERDGSLSPLVMPDFLHPSFLGYQIYATSIWPTLLSMLN